MKIRARLRGATAPLLITFCLVASVIGIGASSAGAYTEGSKYPRDGMSWTVCDGTYKVRDVTRYSGTVKLRLQVFGCSQGYFFARTSTSVKSSILVSLTRRSPYRYDQQTFYGYAAMTNGVQRMRGSCYDAWSNVYGRYVSFCVS